MTEQLSPMVALNHIFLNTKSGAIYQRTEAGKVVLIGQAAYFQVAALLAGVDSSRFGGAEDIGKLGQHYGVSLTEALRERIAEHCTTTQEACDLLMAMGRFYALAHKSDPRERSEHREWLQGAMAGLLPEQPAWAYQLAQELTEVSLEGE